MNSVLLDTSAYSKASDGHAGLAGVMRQSDEILLPTIVLGELHYGFQFGSRTEWNMERLNRFKQIARVRVVEVTEESAERYGIIYAYLRRNGTPLPVNDIWIASMTMEHGATLLTGDKHFQNVPQIVTKLLV